MTALERAESYAAIFLKVGDRWPGYVPLDATRTEGGIYLHGVHMEQVDADTWRLTENDQRFLVRRAPADEQPPNPEETR